jgi:hypothetical protein
MSSTNGGRPLPWHDTPLCTEEGCGLHMTADFTNTEGRLQCAGCGTQRVATKREWAQAYRAEAAWLLVEQGLAHSDRACSRCNRALPLTCERTCPPCVEKDNRERQHELALGVT